MKDSISKYAYLNICGGNKRDTPELFEKYEREFKCSTLNEWNYVLQGQVPSAHDTT